MSIEKYVSFAAKSFTLPDICVRLRTILDDPRSSAEDLGDVISVDPSLTAKVLRLANSSLFRFPSQIESVSKAINVIGGEALYNLVIAETASSAFKKFDTASIDIDKHWYASVYCGMVAKNIALQLNIRGAERFFVMGILQNLSELVVAKRAPKQYLKYVESEVQGLPSDKQQAHFGFTFANCSGIILENWHLPMGLFYPVTHMNDIERQSSDLDIAVLALASRVTVSQLEQEKYKDIELVAPEIANMVTLDKELVSHSAEYAEVETSKVVSLIS
ncbi:HDOD domain-containing protein [Alteromonas sp. D210916BOD_24]|uniref:HDOD domain-containing protein n=1 Tax=Alteromonas sp. D210916BOD_24 TaxID=3157618 RepID=UPI00399C6420